MRPRILSQLFDESLIVVQAKTRRPLRRRQPEAEDSRRSTNTRRRSNSRQFNDRFKRISGIAAHSNLQNAINERALIDLTG